jgi:hypothetical protein
MIYLFGNENDFYHTYLKVCAYTKNKDIMNVFTNIIQGPLNIAKKPEDLIEEEKLFIDFNEGLKKIGINSKITTYFANEKLLRIYLFGEHKFISTDFIHRNIKNELEFVTIEKLWLELSNDKISNIEVVDLQKLYMSKLLRECSEEIKQKIHEIKLDVKPDHFFISSQPSAYIIYKDHIDYDNAIISSSFLKTYLLIENILQQNDNLKLYKPRTLRIELFHKEMKCINLYGLSRED